MNAPTQQESTQDELTVQDSAQPVPELPGRRLREQREGSHLSREEVAHHLRLDVQLIKALEDDDYSRLPSPAYICGYLRSYARLLKLPENEVVMAYSRGQEINSALIPENVRITPKKTINKSIIKLLLLIIAIVIAGGVYLLAEQLGLFSAIGTQKSTTVIDQVVPEAELQLTQELNAAPPENVLSETTTPQHTEAIAIPPETRSNSNASEVTSAPQKSVEDDVSPVTEEAKPAKTVPGETNKNENQSVAQPSQLRLRYLEDSWTEVTDNTGKRLIYRLVEKTSDLTLDGEPPFTVLLGNAPAVEVFYQGKAFDHKRYHRDDIAYFRIGNQ